MDTPIKLLPTLWALGFLLLALFTTTSGPAGLPLMSGQNFFGGVAAVNEVLAPLDDGMFALYAGSARQVGAAAAFDAGAAHHVWVHTFGALNDAQLEFYMQSAAALASTYNALADAAEGAPAQQASISVASVISAPPHAPASGGNPAARMWEGVVGFVAGLLAPLSAV